jgi:predicted nucleic acid-binding protein
LKDVIFISKQTTKVVSRRSVDSYVLDTFAVLCYLRAEEGADLVGSLLADGRTGKARLLMSWINLGEVYYIIKRQGGLEQASAAIEMIKNWPVRLVVPASTDILAAGDIKAKYPLSYADAFAVALAQTKQSELVTGDPEFAKPEQDGVIKIRWLTTSGQ